MAKHRVSGERLGTAVPPANHNIDPDARSVSEIFAPLIISLATELARQMVARRTLGTPNCQCIPDPPADGGPWLPVYTPASGWDYKNASGMFDVAGPMGAVKKRFLPKK